MKNNPHQTPSDRSEGLFASEPYVGRFYAKILVVAIIENTAMASKLVITNFVFITTQYQSGIKNDNRSHNMHL